MHTLDRSFKRKKEQAARQKRRGRVRRVLAVLFGLGALIGIPVALYYGDVPARLTAYLSPDELPDDGPAPAPVQDYVYAPTIVDLAGDPLFIRLGGNDGAPAKLRSLDTPPSLIPEGVGNQVKVVSDTMLNSGVQLMTTLPSRPQDFAFFRSQSNRARATGNADADDTEADASDDADAVDPSESDDNAVPADAMGAGWGETIDNDSEALPEFKKTRIEDTTSVAYVAPEDARHAATQDFIVQILSERTLDSFLSEKQFNGEDAKRAGEAAKSLFDLDVIGPGFVIAARGLRESVDNRFLKLVQVSIYNTDSYIGTLALGDDGSFGPGADPWVKEDLFNYAQENQAVAAPRKYRYLDAIYSAAVRNKVPTGIVGETIVLLSRAHDLNAFADDDDELVLVYSDRPRDGERNTGRILYAAIRTGETEHLCYVFREDKKSDYACLSDSLQEHSITIQNGMVTPVNGVLTSGFGPRKHPLLNTVRIHKGVDWAAPIGTPVFAAFDGTVTFAGDGQGYGNLIRLRHKGSKSTNYAHLNGFAAGISKGATVKAGDIIGYVGTTGLSTGPHLHFELYRGKAAVDPLGTGSTGGSKAAEVLVNKIIRVESAGNATAKNPLSTATGLGQFIESTWLRMIRTYRPDLSKSLTRAEILALRTDPTLSREMVHNLARENEAKLKSRGHAITAGRLYLAHFLGPDGAHTVLSAAAETDLLSLLGAPVIKANPFLTGKDAQWVAAWAERKMSGRGKSSGPVISRRKVKRRSKEFEQYKKAIEDVLVAMASQF
ncbi:MAG: M23 family metallopeptidase [Pseudomonadota bacterium]